MWLIVGLGNPGSRYRFTRHNIGFQVLDLLATRQQFSWQEHKRLALMGRGSSAGQELILVKPLSYMNNSGEVVSALVGRSGMACSSVLLVHDDMDLPFGRLKIKKGGGSGGHKGVDSVQRELDFDDFLRVKMGIGRPEEVLSPEDYVLSPFSADQTDNLTEFLERGSEAVMSIVEEGADRAMNRFNKREASHSPDEETKGE